MNKNVNEYIRLSFAEVIATFALVFIGAGAVLADVFTGGALGIVGVALAHGIVLMAMVYTTTHISGAHVNPAVTISIWANKLISTKKATIYILSQLIGASIAALILVYIFSDLGIILDSSVPALASGVDILKGIIVEAILTFFLVFVIFGVAVDKKANPAIYGLSIGFVLIFDILMGGALTGAAMNPARAFGPALATGIWENQIVYWIGPIIGGLIAGITYKFLYLKKKVKYNENPSIL